jgi:GT2 family glycosyltransferase
VAGRSADDAPMRGERPAARASIVIVTHGQRALTERCLRSLEHCLGDALGAEWELVLVDNASPDDTPVLLGSWSERAIVRLLEENRDFSGGCNTGAAAASGEVLVFLNNDTEVTPGALETLVEQALEPGVAIAGCRLHFPQGTLQHAGVGFVQGPPPGGMVMPEHLFHHQDCELAAARGSFELDCVTAACMAVRAEAFRAVGGFDESYRNGFEDVDLCLRVRMSGGLIVYRGDVLVLHHEGASRGRGMAQQATAERREQMRQNIARFLGRWAGILGPDDELAAHLWDAALQGQVPARSPSDARFAVLGEPTGIGPGAAEARALIAALAASGLRPAAGNHTRLNVAARLSEPLAAIVREAHCRTAAPGTPCLIVPGGAHDTYEVESPAVLRLARARCAVPLASAGSVWASSPALADALVAEGVSPERVAVVPPPVLAAAPGEGGGGVLALLPAHDRERARAVLDALRAMPPEVPVRLLPSVRVRHLDRDLAAVLPRAELLGPCSDEARFAALAGAADVVLAADPSDRFERRALVAAGVGTAALTTDTGGPASFVLGEEAVCRPGAIAERLRAAVAEPGGRETRMRRVAERCAPESIAARLEAQAIAEPA